MKKTLRWLLAAALIGALGWLALRDLDQEAFLQAIRGADLRAVALAALINLTLVTFAAVERLRTMIRPLSGAQPLRYRHLVSVIFAAAATHNLLPMPAGEVLRTVYLARYYGFALGDVTAAQLVEKVLDALGVAIEVLALVLLARLPLALKAPLGAFAGVAALIALALLTVAYRLRPAEIGELTGLRRFLRELGRGVHLLRTPRLWVAGVLYSLLADACNAVMMGLVLYAVGAPLDVGSWVIVSVGARLTGLIPSTPGQLGVQEAGIVAMLGLLGVDAARALAFALLYRVSHSIPVTLIGLVELRRLGITKEAPSAARR